MSFSVQCKILVAALAGLLLFSASPLPAAEPTLTELIAAAKSGSEAARVKAIESLAAQGDKAAEAVAPLTQLLSDSSATVRGHAAYALGAIGAPSKGSAAALSGLLKDADDSVRRQAVKALVAIRPGPKVMIPLFIKLMDDTDPAVQIRVLHATSEAGAAAVPGLIEALQNEKAAYWACVVLREIGPDGKEAVPALAGKLKDANPEIRREAALALGAMPEAAIPAIAQLAAVLDDEFARGAATFALGQIGRIPPATEAKILANAKGSDKFLSTASYWTLARVHPENKDLRREATERLVERIMDKDAHVRVAAARALASLPPAPEITLPIWEKALQNADETTAHHALDALATLGPAAVPRLIDALKHNKLRTQVIHILGQIGPASAPATEILASLINDKDPRVATEAVLTLAKIGPEAKASVSALAACLQRKDCQNAHAIVYTLGKIGPGAMQAEPALLESMKSKDQSLALMSAWALTQLHDKSPAIAAKALPVLIASLSDPLPESRQSAAEALGSLGAMAKEAIPALEKAAKDPQAAVRKAASEALGQIRGLAGK